MRRRTWHKWEFQLEDEVRYKNGIAEGCAPVSRICYLMAQFEFLKIRDRRFWMGCG